MTSSAPAAPFPLAAAAGRNPRRRLVRKRFGSLLGAALLCCLPFHPPAWHAALRNWLVWQARRHGCSLSVAAIDGGPFGTTHLHGLRCRQLDPLSPDGSGGTDVFVNRADLTLAWTAPWLQRPAPSWVRALTLDGVRGRWDLRRTGRAPVPPPPPAGPGRKNGWPSLAMIPGDAFVRALGAVFPSLRRFSARLVPETFLLRADDLCLERGRYRLHAAGLRLSGARDGDGQFLAHELTLAGPGFQDTLLRPHGQTSWQGSRLTVSSLPLGLGVNLVGATLDGSHLARHRLDWEGKLTALGGEVRGQGTVDFSRDHLGLEVAASLRGAAVRPLARSLGIGGPVDGLIDQGSFSFRGDPENWPAAQMWLAAHATDFRWGKRRWQDLELQAVVVNWRVQVHRLELRQNANRLSLTGECPLPPGPPTALTAADALRRWREGGFFCQIDARLEDLAALADLFGPQAPAFAGRMSVNGALGAPPGARQEIDGYLNVEGTRLLLRGAPLDYLRSTLVFKDGGVRLADLQATHGGDYFTGAGSMRLDGPPRYEGVLRAAVAQPAVYAPALAGLPWGNGLARVTDLDATLQWRDATLRFDRFRGRFDGAPFTMGGTANLGDTGHPSLDLTFDGKDVPLSEVCGQEWVRAAGGLTIQAAAVRSAAGEWMPARGAVYFPEGADGPARVSLVAHGPGDAAVALFGWSDCLAEVSVGGAVPGQTPDAAWRADETPWAKTRAGQSLPAPLVRSRLPLR